MVARWEGDVEERERERERDIDRLPPALVSTKDQNHNLGMCPDWGPNLQQFWCTA